MLTMLTENTIIQLSSGITRFRVINGELYATKLSSDIFEQNTL